MVEDSVSEVGSLSVPPMMPSYVRPAVYVMRSNSGPHARARNTQDSYDPRVFPPAMDPEFHGKHEW